MMGEMVGGIIAVVVGIVAVVMLVADAELVISVLSLTFGITALIWVLKARISLSKGSSLKEFTLHFLFTVVFVLCFSFWGIVVKVLSLKDIYGGVISFPQYLFISFAYITFVVAAYKIRKIGEEFGFNVQAKKIESVMKKNSKKKK